jgi:hypothetical protein
LAKRRRDNLPRRLADPAEPYESTRDDPPDPINDPQNKFQNVFEHTPLLPNAACPRTGAQLSYTSIESEIHALQSRNRFSFLNSMRWLRFPSNAHIFITVARVS